MCLCARESIAQVFQSHLHLHLPFCHLPKNKCYFFWILVAYLLESINNGDHRDKLENWHLTTKGVIRFRNDFKHKKTIEMTSNIDPYMVIEITLNNIIVEAYSFRFVSNYRDPSTKRRLPDWDQTQSYCMSEKINGNLLTCVYVYALNLCSQYFIQTLFYKKNNNKTQKHKI